MTPTHHDELAAPFCGQADYLAELCDLMTARANRLGVEFEKVEKERDAVTSLTVADDNGGPLDEKIRQLRAVEERLLAGFTNRVEASRVAGNLPALEVVADEHDLGEVEQIVLYLVVVAAMSMEFTTTLAGLSRFYFPLDVNPEMAVAFAGVNMAGRIELRRQLGEDGKLIKAGLVELERAYDDRPAGFWSSTLHIGGEAFDRIVGLTARPKDACPRCGQVG